MVATEQRARDGTGSEPIADFVEDDIQCTVAAPIEWEHELDGIAVAHVADADALTANNPTFSALPNVAGTTTLASSFDWGLPFFYGRRVYVAIEGQSTAAGLGPFVAY